MQNLFGNYEMGSKMFEDASKKVWESYLTGMEKSLEFSKSMTSAFMNSFDQSKDAQKTFTNMTSEAIKNMTNIQAGIQATYTDLMKQGLQSYTLFANK
ncbi:MAG: hypothetical protein ACM3UZ_01605 [Acidobacteriota bacterium]